MMRFGGRALRNGDQRFRVAVVGSAHILQDTLRALTVHPRFELVLRAPALAECRVRLAARNPDVIVIASAVEQLAGVLREARNLVPFAAIVVCGTSGDDATELATTARAAVTGFVGIDATLDTLISVIESVASGELRYATPSSGEFIRGFTIAVDEDRRSDVGALLTAREREIAILMSTESNKAIAERLGIELSTVKNHVHNILAKLLVRHRRDAVALLREARDPSRNGS